MFYDLHIHSCLSPCSDDSMSVNNIVNMAIIKELDIIAITDHNTTKHLSLLKEIAKDKIKIIYGIELQTKEEIHVLAYFKNDSNIELLQNWLDLHLVKIKNNPDFFGHQYILDNKDQIINEEQYLLINSLDTSLKETIDFVHSLNGSIVLAHVLNDSYSISSQLGFIPLDIEFEGIEVRNKEQIQIVKQKYPYIKDTLFLINSDAHQLVDINEPTQEITEAKLNQIWRNL